MSKPIKWNTKDGKRPSILYLLTFYWKGTPPWAPLSALIFTLFMVWASGLLWLTVGPNADIRNAISVSGTFQPHRTIRSPYRFITNEGASLTLYCEPRMQQSYCLPSDAIGGGVVQMVYAPFNHSIFRVGDGILLSVSDGARIILSKERRLTDMRKFDNVSPIIRLLESFVENIILIPIALVMLSSILGLAVQTVSSIKNIDPNN